VLARSTNAQPSYNFCIEARKVNIITCISRMLASLQPFSKRLLLFGMTAFFLALVEACF
jgi:hypothetical protein